MQYLKEHFVSIKNYLNSTNSSMIKKYFNVLGYKYSSIIPNNNFFHFATEAYLISAIKESQEKLTTDAICEMVLKASVEEKDFLENLEILIGTYQTSHNIVKFSEAKLAKIFLKKLEILKQASSEETNSDSKALIQILRKAVNLTINELSGDEGQEDSLLLYDTFIDLDKQATLEGFCNAYLENLGKNAYYAKNSCEVFYNYSITSIEQFVEDLNSFNQQNTSIIYIGFAFIQAQYRNQSTRLTTIYKLSRSNLKEVKKDLDSKTGLIKSEMASRLEIMNKWVKSTYSVYKDTYKEKYPTVFEKISYLNESYFTPVQTKMVNYSGEYYTFILNSYSKGVSKFDEAKLNILEKVSATYKETTESAEKYVNLTVDKFGKIAVVQVCFDKLKISKEEFYTLLTSIQKYIKEYDIENFKKIASETYTYGKNRILQSYHNFLGTEKVDKESETK